jgi:hypothetical protein
MGDFSVLLLWRRLRAARGLLWFRLDLEGALPGAEARETSVVSPAVPHSSVIM